MIAAIILVSLAFLWLLWETWFLTINLNASEENGLRMIIEGVCYLVVGLVILPQIVEVLNKILSPHDPDHPDGGKA